MNISQQQAMRAMAAAAALIRGELTEAQQRQAMDDLVIAREVCQRIASGELVIAPPAAPAAPAPVSFARKKRGGA
jgi:hypothetical protein